MKTVCRDIDALDLEGSIDEVIARLQEWQAAGWQYICYMASDELYDENSWYILGKRIDD